MDENGQDDPDWWQRHDAWLALRESIEERGGTVPGDADVIGTFLDLYRYSCQPSVRFSWDSWARCHIKCEHGESWRDSHLLNLTEAFVLARREWATGANHPTWDENQGK
jgi:hypothetical protein